MKILVGYGLQGLLSVDGLAEFNWTKPNEPVNIDQIVCCNSTSCGCERSFHGIHSRQKTSRAVVIEIPDIEFAQYCEKIYLESMEKYRLGGISDSGASKAAMYRKTCFVKVRDYVSDLPIGTVVTIKKDSRGDKYEMFHS